MKIYKNKKTKEITIVFGKDDENTNVTLVVDRGAKKQKNMFGQEVPRYTFHCATPYGDSGYCSTTNNKLIAEDDVQYKVVKSGKRK